MTRLDWGAAGERFYEAGVDRGVLYVDGQNGVSWNGLISVSEESSGGDTKPHYIDGYKYSNRASDEEFEATVQAYTYPDEFGQCDGTQRISNGLFAMQQRRKSFGLSYRTKIGNDTDGVDHAYKIHVVYNAHAMPSHRANSTIGDNINPFNFSWKLTTRPPLFRGYRPTSHFVIDSRDAPASTLLIIEDILYGNETSAARLPTVAELVFWFVFDGTVYDAGSPSEPSYITFDGGSPSSIQTSTIDGGAP